MTDLKSIINNFIFELLKKLFQKNSVFYINGADTLPPPLSAEEEAKIFASANEHPELRKKLVEHNLRLVVYIAKKFENTGVGLEDLISIGTIGLIKAVNTFKVEKNIKLATYASRCIENEILMYIRKNTGKSDISFDEPLNTDWDGNELLLSDVLGGEPDSIQRDIEENEERALIIKAVESLPKRECEIIKMRFGINGDGREKTQKEVADMLGISQSYISRIEKKVINRLRDDLTKSII